LSSFLKGDTVTAPIVNNAVPSTASAATPPATNLGNTDFMQLLVTQLQNQDPMNPVDDQQFIAQMAQLSSLQATNQLASQVGQMVSAQQQMGVLQLVGQDVQYLDPNGNSVQGKVSGVRLTGPTPTLLIGNSEVSPGQVQTVL
jgi:flagellar basal-body rod modification protein FlgD